MTATGIDSGALSVTAFHESGYRARSCKRLVAVAGWARIHSRATSWQSLGRGLAALSQLQHLEINFTGCSELADVTGSAPARSEKSSYYPYDQILQQQF